MNTKGKPLVKVTLAVNKLSLLGLQNPFRIGIFHCFGVDSAISVALLSRDFYRFIVCVVKVFRKLIIGTLDPSPFPNPNRVPEAC